jgi:hypothetical protein
MFTNGGQFSKEKINQFEVDISTKGTSRYFHGGCTSY